MVQSRFLMEGQEALNPFGRADNKSNFYEERNRYEKGSYFDRNNKYNNDEFVDFGSVTSNIGGYSSSYAKSMLVDNKPKENNNVSKEKVYKSGVKVRHKKFGIGTVITTKGFGDTLVVDVAFPTVGIKSLAVKYAPMEIL